MEWFWEVREDHFFRQNRTPYTVWIAEVALQQTRIAAALEPLKIFLETFPNLKTLADAAEEEVLQAFQGLGYYSRARNLHKGARYILKNFGDFPKRAVELKKIPSIGDYTSAAISSICFGEREPAVDGNLRRILARTEGWSLPPDSPKLTGLTYQKLQKIFQKNSHHPGDLNEGLMELGQKICLPQKPKCQDCPFGRWCKGHRKGEPEKYPTQSVKREKVSVLWKAYVIKNKKGKYLLQKWGDFYFLKGHLSFPSSLLFPETGEEKRSTEILEFPPDQLTELSSLSHTITRHKIEIKPYLVPYELIKGKKFPSSIFQWTSEEEMTRVLVPSALLKIWKGVKKAEEDWKNSLFG